MRNKLIVLTFLVFCSCIGIHAQGRGNIIKYINENKLYRNGNDVTVTKLDLEWPVELEGDGMQEFQEQLCKDMFDVDASTFQEGWTEFHKRLGTEIQHMPDSVNRHYIYLTLQELWITNGQYASFYYTRQDINEDGSQAKGEKKFLTYDFLNHEIIPLDKTFIPYADIDQRETFEALLDRYSVCDDNDKPNIDLTTLPKDFALAGSAMIIGLGGPVDHDNFSTVSLNNLYQLGLLKKSFVKWIQGKSKAKKNKESVVAPTNFDSSLSADSLTYNVSEMASFPGGNDSLMTFLRKNIEYPQIDMAMHRQGRTVIAFIVEKDGSLSDITVMAPLSAGLDREAVRVVRLMPRWNPAKLNGNKIRTRMTLPITYRIGTSTN